MGFFDSTSTSINQTLAGSQSGTVNALGSGYLIQTSPAAAFGGGGNYAPDYSFSTISAPTVNATTNLSLQLASGSPGSTFSNSQTASTNSLWQWAIVAAGVILFFWLYHRHS